MTSDLAALLPYWPYPGAVALVLTLIIGTESWAARHG